MCRVVVLVIKPIAYLMFSLPSSWSLLELPFENSELIKGTIVDV